MAPEQLEGREADARSDLFAFGAVLYEMVTGRRAFVGESQASVIAAILEHDPPPISTLQPLALARARSHRQASAWRKIRTTAGRPRAIWSSELKWIAEVAASPVSAGHPAPATDTADVEDHQSLSLRRVSLLAAATVAIVGRLRPRWLDSHQAERPFTLRLRRPRVRRSG